MIHILFVLAIIACVAAVLVYIVQRAGWPQPVTWIAYGIIFIIALLALLPLIGVHVPAS